MQSLKIGEHTMQKREKMFFMTQKTKYVDENHLKPIYIFAFEQASVCALLSCSYSRVCFFIWSVTWKFT